MGALIQTKGTQFLALFFSNRFNATNLPVMRTLAGGSLKNNFAFGKSLLDISDAFVGMWAADGSDVLYPTATVTTVTQSAAGSSTLTFTSALPAFVQNGMAIDDESAPKAIPRGTNMQLNSSTQVTLSAPLKLSVNAGDAIVFSDKNHPNLKRRWRHYLQNDLLAENHSAIQSAIYDALSDDPGCTYITFQSIESASQKVLTATEFDLKNGKLDTTTKHRQVVLLTSRTTAQDPVDTQT
jgi:hypothetical protein